MGTYRGIYPVDKYLVKRKGGCGISNEETWYKPGGEKEDEEADLIT